MFIVLASTSSSRNLLKTENNKKLILATIWKMYSVLLQYVGKTEYSTIVAEITKAYQIDVQLLEERLLKNQQDYVKFKEDATYMISVLEEKMEDASNCKYCF